MLFDYVLQKYLIFTMGFIGVSRGNFWFFQIKSPSPETGEKPVMGAAGGALWCLEEVGFYGLLVLVL